VNISALYSCSRDHTVPGRARNIEREFEDRPDFHSVCKESSQLAPPYYQMWTKLFQLRWEIPLDDSNGRIEISLKLPFFGFPPHAFVDSNSDPVLPNLSMLSWWATPFDFPERYGYFANDVLQATALHRYLSNKGQIISLKFVVSLVLD
jgi:hypothetical protein